MKFNPIKRIMMLMLAAVLFVGSSMTVMASGASIGTNRGYIRAKLEYEHDDGITGLSDDIIEFVDGWQKTGDWFYYKDPVSPGDKIRFITGVKVPVTWTEDLQNKNFAVIVTVEVSEVAPNDTGWDNNTDILYAKNFDLWSIGYERDENVIIKEGKLAVDINEYQLDANGKEIPYVNDKTIVPGQSISKIVEFELTGELGSNTLKEVSETVKTKVIEVVKTGQETFLLASIIGISIMAGGGYFFFKRKKRGGAR